MTQIRDASRIWPRRGGCELGSAAGLTCGSLVALGPSTQFKDLSQHPGRIYPDLIWERATRMGALSQWSARDCFRN